MAYTYRIYHPPTNQHYYGVRYKDDCSPDDLWVSYFTSSKPVHKLIEAYGSHTFRIQRTKTFKTADEAKRWETKFLKRIDAASRPNWLNIVNGPDDVNKRPRSSGPTKPRKPHKHSREYIERLAKKFGFSMASLV